MTRYDQMPADALKQELQDVQAAFVAVKGKNLKLDMSRGKPGKTQLNLASGILSVLTDPADCTADGMDARNYGELMGLPSCRKLFAELLGCKPEEVFAGGNASLTLMYDVIAKAFTHGLLHSERPWS